jgi:O-acetyl-ADP-ribose deacetylase (regulator of RNase III)/transcriptional regulator with XRE-family HTH domain
MPFNIVRNDISKMNVDVIVNAANTELKAGGGVCGAIFNVAGADRLQKACDNLAPIQTGEAVITKGFALPAKYIIHTAGPVYKDGTQNEEELLRECYINSLNLAKKKRCNSIAFPLISSGIYGYPKDEALNVATNSIREWLADNDMDVSLVVFDKTAFSISQELLGNVRSFIDENYVDERKLYDRRREQRLREEIDFQNLDHLSKSQALYEDVCINETYATDKSIKANVFPPRKTKSIDKPKTGTLDNLLVRLDEPFSMTLLRLIDAKGRSDIEVYKRANIDRKLFSKIRTGKGYMPSKKTIIAFAIALELSLTETRDLLEHAGFALSRSVVFDVIIEYFITNRKYDIFEINNVLFEYDQQLLGV